MEEKYSPFSLSELNFSFDLNKKLKRLSSDLPNIILYGNKGCGKYTRLFLTLKEALNSDCNTKPVGIEVDTGKFTTLDSKKIICGFISNHHIEIDLEQHNAENTLIPFLLYYSKTKNITTNKKKYIILRHFEVLKKKIQNALRVVVEKNHSKICLLISSSSYTKIIEPLRSRFVCLKVPSPTEDEVISIINIILECENRKLYKNEINMLLRKSYYGSFDRINLNEVFLMLEGTLIKNKVYVSKRNEDIDKLILLVKRKNHKMISEFISYYYEKNSTNFVELVFNDFYRRILPMIIDKHKMTEITQKYDAMVNEDFITEKILIAEAYLFEVCCLL
jgi:replication factor C subunit 3/5